MSAQPFRGYALVIEMPPMRIPASGFLDIGDVVSAITHQLQLYGRPLPLADIPELTRALIEWSDSPDKPWITSHHDATIKVWCIEPYAGGVP